jgi:hypothetical protein
MAKEFYTEKDIEDLVKRGVLSLEVNDNCVLGDQVEPALLDVIIQRVLKGTGLR